MIYRDDRAVLRDRARELEAELSEASRRLAETHAASARAAELEAELAETRRELDRVRTAIAGGSARSAAGFEAAQRARLALPIGALALAIVGLSAASSLIARPSARQSRAGAQYGLTASGAQVGEEEQARAPRPEALERRAAPPPQVDGGPPPAGGVESARERIEEELYEELLARRRARTGRAPRSSSGR